MENHAKKILQILNRNFLPLKWEKKDRDPFQILIATIISQNTSDKNTAKAYENLSKRFKMLSKVLANAEISEIEECLKVAGLYRNKARVIKHISKIIEKKFGGDLKSITCLPFEESRKTLMELPGVGPKTADVVLLFAFGKPTIPVDTHVNRVAERLGLVPKNGNYETVRKSLQSLYCPEDYLRVHKLLISLGRKYCKAKKPLCLECPLNVVCPSKKMA
ncbi:MAG: endonuclease III [Desulfonauticus sp.]|nr:endonuclease III [Desulfonauticus sp.]